MMPPAQKDATASASVHYLLGLVPHPNDALDELRIGDLADEFNLTLRTIRFYETKGILQPARRNTTRLFSQKDRSRLRLALLGALLGFTLSEARQLIELNDQSTGRRDHLESTLEKLGEQRDNLVAQRQEVEASMAALASATAHIRRQLGTLG